MPEVTFAETINKAQERGAQRREAIKKTSESALNFLKKVGTVVGKTYEIATNAPDVAIAATGYGVKAAAEAGVAAGKAVGKAAAVAGEVAVGIPLAMGIGAYEGGKILAQEAASEAKAAYHAAERGVNHCKSVAESLFHRGVDAAVRFGNRGLEIGKSAINKADQIKNRGIKTAVGLADKVVYTGDAIATEMGAFAENVKAGFAGAEAGIKGAALDVTVNAYQGFQEFSQKVLEGMAGGASAIRASQEAATAKTNEVRQTAQDKHNDAVNSFQFARDVRL